VRLQSFVCRFPQAYAEYDDTVLFSGNLIHHPVSAAVKPGGIKVAVAFKDRVGKFYWRLLKAFEQVSRFKLCGVGQIADLFSGRWVELDGPDHDRSPSALLRLG